MIECALCVHDVSGKYYINTYVTILSLFENTREKIAIHILHDDTIEPGRKDLQALCARYGHDIFFHRVPDFEPEVVASISKWFNIGTMYRYYIHEFVQADKAIYLDSDIIVNRDIKELHDIDLGSNLIAAAKDHTSYWKHGRINPKFRKKILYLGLTPDTYFNAGLQLLNLKEMRKLCAQGNIFVEKTLQAINDGIKLDYPDQDIMNHVVKTHGSALMLDKSFNFWNPMLHSNLDELEGKIVHFICKPDKNFYPAHLLFWKYYAKTPFASDMIERMDSAFRSHSMSFLRAYLQNSKRRRQAEDYLAFGFFGMLKQAIKRNIFKH